MTLTKNLLVATDFSKASELALEAARTLAKQNDAKVTLVHVYDPMPMAPLVGRLGEGMADIMQGSDAEQSIHDELTRLRDTKLPDIADVKCALVLSKSAAEGLCHYAEKEDVDLIVISTHGRTGLTHLLIGSVAEAVVRHAPCPVLTLRSRAKD